MKEQEKRAEIEVLQKQKTALEKKLKIENNYLQVFTNEETILSRNQTIGGQNTGLKANDLKEAIEFHRAKLTEILNGKISHEQNIKDINAEILKINKQLEELNSKKDNHSSEILVTVASEKAGNADFEIKYVVFEAGWYANYDLRVEDITKPINLLMKAQVFQNSGENWDNVMLTISNGEPLIGGMLGRLEPWFLRFYEPQNTMTIRGSRSNFRPVPGTQLRGRVIDDYGEVIIGATISFPGTSVGTQTDFDGNFSLVIPENANQIEVRYVGYESQLIDIYSNFMNVSLNQGVLLEQAVVVDYKKPLIDRDKQKNKQTISVPTEQDIKPTTINYDIKIPYTIASDGKVNTVEIEGKEVPVEYIYSTIPKIEEAAYLTANLTDWQDLNLFDGEINLFFEGTYLGKSIFDLSNATDTLNISLGIDKNILVKRERIKEFIGKRFLSSFQTASRAYEITIRNNKNVPINITVEDQFPISTQKEITVEDLSYAEGNLSADSNITRWKNNLAPKVVKKYELKYSVKYPKDRVLRLE